MTTMRRASVSGIPLPLKHRGGAPAGHRGQEAPNAWPGAHGTVPGRHGAGKAPERRLQEESLTAPDTPPAMNNSLPWQVSW